MKLLSPGRLRLLFIFLTPLIAFPIAPRATHAQASPPARKRPAPPPAPPAEDQQQFICYWTTETGWRTELQLRNNQVSQVLVATPVLRAATRRHIRLPCSSLPHAD